MNLKKNHHEQIYRWVLLKKIKKQSSNIMENLIRNQRDRNQRQYYSFTEKTNMTFIPIPDNDFVKIKWQIYHTYELRGQTFSKYLG